MIEFFKAFNIPPKWCEKCPLGLYNSICDKEKPCSSAYPEITDKHILQLMCIGSKHHDILINNEVDLQSLRESVLINAIDTKDEIYNEVRKLFGVEQ